MLSELPAEWKARVTRWSKLNRRYKTDVEGRLAPDPNEEYLLYQTLIGAWPLNEPDDSEYRTFCDRIQEYMAKAMKEAKVNTSWINPDQAYDEAARLFIEHILDRSRPNQFLEEFLPFQKTIAEYGMYNSLSQVLVKTLAPGIPDFYQGTELWDFSLVDPDNRRPVDFTSRMGMLAELQQACKGPHTNRVDLAQKLLDSRKDGRIKLYVTMVGLHLRRDHARLFSQGEYVPLDCQGPKRDHLCAFARIHGEEAVVAMAPRLVAGLMADKVKPPTGSDVWGDTAVTVPSWRPGSRYRNLFTNQVLTTTTEEERQVLKLSEVCAHFPIAMLERMT